MPRNRYRKLGLVALLSLSGAEASNYSLSAHATSAATITTKALSQSGLSVAASKVYDATTAATVIGTSSFYSAPDGREALSVGFTFLTRDHWGGNTNRILKGLMFAHIFKQHDAVWLHIGPDNIRSQTATLRLGAEFVEDAMLDLGTGPHMVKCYRLTRSTWAASEATSS